MSEPVYLPNVDNFKKYIKKIMNDYGVTHQIIADALDIAREEVTRMIGRKRSIKSRSRDMTYEDAQIIIDTLMKIISPFPKTTVKKVKTGHKRVKKFGTVKLSDKVSVAAEIMTKKGYTQLLITDETGNYVGMLTDFALLNRILHPQEKSREWLKHFRDQTIKMTNLWEEVPTFSKDANPMEVAQSLAYHYAVLIDDKDGNYGLITRNDLVKVLRNSFPLT